MNRADEFEDLYRRTRVDLLAYLTRRAGSPEEAADLLAETYLIAWRRLEAIPNGEQARLWLFGVARNLLKKGASRSRAAEVLVARLAAEVRVGQALREPPSDKRAQLVLRAFSRLGEKDREILALTAWEGLTPAEIAGVLGMTANRVRVRLHRARAKVRRQLRPATEARRHRAAVAVEPD